MGLDLFLSSCQSASNLSLVCRDGVIPGHKLMVASVSGWVKSLLSEAPSGDEVTLYLPDYHRGHVETFLSSVLFDDEAPLDIDLCKVLKVDKENIIENIEDIVESIKDLDPLEEEKYQRTDDDLKDTKIEVSNDSNIEKSRIYKGLAQNKFKKEAKENTERRLKRAVSAFQSGAFYTIRECALVFRINKSTLNKALKDPDYKFRGQGFVSKVLSKLEEEKVRDIVLERTTEETNLSFRQVQDLIHEFFLQAIRDDPSRYSPWAHKDPPHYPNRGYVQHFLKRHGLTDKLRKPFGNPRTHCCNICNQRYPVRQSLIEHKRNVHFGC